jgi:putative redox protein
MKATVKWTGKASFEGISESGHSVIMDGSPDIGGEDRGPRPMEMLLLGLGGCTSIDVMLILGKGRQDVTDCVVQIDAERAPTEPKVFTRIHVHFVVSGRKLDPKRVEKAIHLSAEKYCSASIMLGKTATMSHDFEIVEVA